MTVKSEVDVEQLWSRLLASDPGPKTEDFNDVFYWAEPLRERVWPMLQRNRLPLFNIFLTRARRQATL